jgi:outer membrane protein OmpA-like peptidoglycan-associated protein
MEESGGGHSAAAAFTDLMASLLVIFVLLFVVALNQRAGNQQTIQEELIRSLRGNLQAAGLDTASINRDSFDKNAVVIVFPDSLLFDRGSPRMRSAGTRILQSAAPRIAAVLCDKEMRPRLETVVVEGHTDASVPFGMTAQGGRAYNLRLSQLRSMDVVSESMTALAASPERDCYLNLVSATGRGRENLLQYADSLDARQRRVILKIRLRTDAADEVGAATRDGK